MVALRLPLVRRHFYLGQVPERYRDMEDAGILTRIRNLTGTDSKAILSRLVFCKSIRIESTLGGEIRSTVMPRTQAMPKARKRKQNGTDTQLPELVKLRDDLREEIARLDRDIRKIEGRRRQ
jgi:hypothetical protein